LNDDAPQWRAQKQLDPLLLAATSEPEWSDHNPTGKCYYACRALHMSVGFESHPDASSPGSLARRIRERLPGAEEELMERYSRGITAILSRTCKDREAIEDLRQETLRLVIEKVRNGELREPERLSGFVCGAARNLAIDYSRRRARRKLVEIEDYSQLPEQRPDQMEQFLRKEQARLARKVLNEMETERYRQVLYSFYIAEESKDSICARLALSSLNFNRVLHRAKERFRELYREAAGRVQK
jgi:RNA polymerase sigma-70 factor (ECF subfamily)